MARTQIRGNSQIMDSTINVEKLQNEFLAGTTWVVSTANDATITGLQNPVNANDATNKAYVDALVSTTAKGPDGFAPDSTEQYPQTYKGDAIVEGDPFYITDISGGNVVGTRTVNVGDMLIALVDNPGATADSDWIIAESNRDTATESIEGVIRIATQAEADNGSIDNAAITPLKLAGYITDNDLDIQAGNGLTQNGKNFDVRNSDGSITVGTDDIGVRIGNNNGDSLEITTSGVELAATISGDRTFSNNITVSGSAIVSGSASINGGLVAAGSVTLGTNPNDAQLNADPDGNVDLAIATVKYVKDEIGVLNGTPIYNELPTVTDGSTDVVLDNTPRADTQRVYLNGVRQVPGASNDYTISGDTITFTDALAADDIVVVDYIY